MRYLCSIFLLLCWLKALNAQQTTFSKVFSNFPLNPENGWVLNKIQGGYILLSAANCFDNSNYTCCMISKLDDAGEITWSNIYPFRPTTSNMVVHDNKIYASGHTNGANSQFVLYSFDSLGNVLWNKQYGDPTVEDEFPHLALWGNKLVLSGAQDRNINNRPAPIMYFVVTDMDGNQLNDFYYGDDNESTLSIKSITSSQGDYISSFLYCPDTCFLDLKAGVIAFDPNGNLKWKLNLPYSYNPYECIPAQIDSNSLAVKWYVDNTTIPNHDLTPPAIFFTNMSGNVLDTVIFQNQTLKEIRNMEPVWENGLVGCGHEYPDYINQSSPKLFGWLFRIDENHDLLWERSYIDNTHQGVTFELQHIIPTSDGGYLATGTIDNFMTGVWESHNWLLKLDSVGCLSPGCGNINYITDTQEAVFLKGKGIKIYPNPASDYVHVAFPADFIPGQNTNVVLISNAGTIVRQEQINAADCQLNLSGVTTGMYYLMILQGNEIIDSERVIVQH